jgi:hypothetical protein
MGDTQAEKVKSRGEGTAIIGRLIDMAIVSRKRGGR